jgi:hypothetical protein
VIGQPHVPVAFSAGKKPQVPKELDVTYGAFTNFRVAKSLYGKSSHISPSPYVNSNSYRQRGCFQERAIQFIYF